MIFILIFYQITFLYWGTENVVRKVLILPHGNAYVKSGSFINEENLEANVKVQSGPILEKKGKVRYIEKGTIFLFKGTIFLL